MKKRLVTAVFLMICGLALLSQTPPPPPDNPSGGGNGPVGGGAPVGGGIIVLIALAAGYGTRKIYELKKICNSWSGKNPSIKPSL